MNAQPSSVLTYLRHMLDNGVFYTFANFLNHEFQHMRKAFEILFSVKKSLNY